MLTRIGSGKRLWLVAVEGVLVVVLARFVLEPDQAFGWVIVGGYWFMLAAVTLFLTAFVPLAWEKARATRLDRFHAGVLALIVGVSVIWSAQERPGFKILADEVLLLGTSMGMHYERDAAYPVRATDVQGPFAILGSVLDKRPLLFPFLTATVHDLTGYRPANAFYLNMGLAVLFLLAAYAAGASAGGSRWAGVLMVALFAGLPLLAQQASGGGFELLNLLLIVVLGLALVWYLEAPDDRRLQAMSYAALLLASTRYESLVFLLPALVAAVWGWWRVGRVLLPWTVAISPVFLLPALVQNRIFSGQSGAWEMASMPGVTTPFAFEYFAPNLGHALAFFFDFGPYQPSSPVFAALGLIALPFYGLLVVRSFRLPASHSPREQAWSLLAVGLLGVTMIYLFYFWGQFDHPVIRRLSLPAHLLMALAVVVVVGRMAAREKVARLLTLVAAGGFLFHSLPVMAKRAYAYDYAPGVEMEFRTEFLGLLPERDFLFIDNDSVFWITQKVPASPVAQAQARKEGLTYHLRNHSFSQIYVFQSLLIDDQTGERRVDPADDLGPDFELETVWERRVQALLFARISRVTTIRHEGEAAARATEAVPVAVERRTTEELEKARTLYLENWIKKLP